MDPDTFDSAAARSALADAGLIATASLGLPEHADVSSEDPDVVAAGAKLLRTALDRTAEMGASRLCGVLYGAMKKHMAPMSDRGRANSVEAIRDLADQAKTLGVLLSLEVVNRYESNLLNTGRDAWKFLDEVGRPEVSIHLDTYHMNIEESDMFQPFLDTRNGSGTCTSVRATAATWAPDRSISRRAFRALDRIGYDGPIVFESFSSAVVSPTLSNTLGIWRNLWNDSDHLAAHANRFIRDHLAAVRTIELH